MKNDGQDDSKYIAASIYVMNVVSVVIIVSNISLVGFLNARLVVLCLFHLLGNIAVLCLVFMPKVVFSIVRCGYTCIVYWLEHNIAFLVAHRA